MVLLKLTDERFAYLAVARSQFGFGVLKARFPTAGLVHVETGNAQQDAPSQRRYFGFGWTFTSAKQHIAAPLWLPVVLFGAAAYFAFRRRPPIPGICLVCGYD